MSLSADDAARVRAWAAALSAGEPVTWAEFRHGAGPIPGPVPGPVPGAAQLEVLRRLAALHVDRPIPRYGDLAATVLASVGPGRGLVDPPLAGLESVGRFGATPVEPELLPGNEIVRAASGALVPLLLRPGPTRTTGSRRRLLRRRRFAVYGSPLTAAALRDALHGAGWAEGGRGAVHLVVGRDLETMMGEQWHVRAREGGERRWRPLWRRAITAGLVPPRLRLAAIAERLAAEHGPDRVHVLLGATIEEVAQGVHAAIGTRVAPADVRADPEATDLLRRLNPFLVLRGGPGAPAAALGRWDAALAAVREGGAVPRTERLGAPPGMVGRAVEAAAVLGDRLVTAAENGDYAVHGDPRRLVPHRSRATARAVDPDAVADLAVRLLAALWTLDPTEGPG